MNPKVFAIVATDSRGRDLLTNPLQENTLFKCHYIIRGGASIKTLEREIISLIGRISVENADALYIVKIGAGICEITKKLYHSGGQDLVLRDHSYVLNHLLNCKLKLLSLGKKILVSFATIPPVSFQQAYQYYLAQGKVSKSQYDNCDRSIQQDIHLYRLNQINKAIILENTKQQCISGLNPIRPSQLLWHLQVLREARRRKNSAKVLRIPASALMDGIHAGNEVAIKWAQSLFQSLTKDSWSMILALKQ